MPISSTSWGRCLADPIASAYYLAQIVGIGALNKAGYNDPKDSAITNAVNMTRHYLAIANDPPDPNFAAPVALDERTMIDPQSADPLTLAWPTWGHRGDRRVPAALIPAWRSTRGRRGAPASSAGCRPGPAIQTYATGQATRN